MPSPKPTLDHALTLHRQGRLEEARACYKKLLLGAPRHADLLGLLGTVESQLGNAAAAQKALEHSLEVAPNQPKVLHNLGTALLSLGQPEKAHERYAAALALAPDFAEAWLGRSNALRHLGRLEEALESVDHALAARPGLIEALTNRGNLLMDLQRPAEAITAHEQAVTLQPGRAEAHFNLGNARRLSGALEPAANAYKKALELRPDFPEAAFNLGLVRLTQGDYGRGWRPFELRWRVEGSAERSFPQPRWTGAADLTGKTLLVYAEQGLGDVLQFCRFVPELEARGASVVLEVPPSLVALLQSLSPSVQVIPEESPLPPFDLHCPLLSLPLALGSTLETLPNRVPYLSADPALVADWATFLGPRTRPRVGLFWSGNLTLRTRRDRSIPFADLASLLERPVDFHALQKDLDPAEAPAVAACPRLHSHPGRSKDFANTAALMANLDLVVTVDSSIAHLAGALSKPTWILLPHTADWRWMRDRDDSPWYPTTRLFRQTAPGDWDSVLGQVSAVLTGMAESYKP